MTVALTPKVAAVAGNNSPGGIRLTESFVQYDVSKDNPKNIANLGRAIAGSLHNPKHTFYDPEKGVERELGDVLVSVDLSDPKRIVLQHRDTAGMGDISRAVRSAGFITFNPVDTFGMKVIGWVSDPEKIYLQKVIQMLATLEQEGMFGPPGASTLDLSDWKIETSDAWRDVVITRKSDEPKPEENIFEKVSFSDVMRAAAQLPIV